MASGIINFVEDANIEITSTVTNQGLGTSSVAVNSKVLAISGQHVYYDDSRPVNLSVVINGVTVVCTNVNGTLITTNYRAGVSKAVASALWINNKTYKDNIITSANCYWTEGDLPSTIAVAKID